ncbi:MAG: hypothetical protein ACRD8Z_00705 [Nitrososphaeraceae archaeon]
MSEKDGFKNDDDNEVDFDDNKFEGNEEFLHITKHFLAQYFHPPQSLHLIFQIRF